MTTRVLIVDDEDRARKNMVRLMENRGFKVLSGSSATEAQSLITSNQFDVVVTDMLMENEKAGLSVLNAAKEKNDLTQVIIITAFGSIPNAVDSTSQGAFAYIEKDAEDVNELLCRKVEESLKKREQRRIERNRFPFRCMREQNAAFDAQYDVMFLYDSEDKPFLESICAQLKEYGLTFWYDGCNLLPSWIYLEEADQISERFRAVSVIIGQTPQQVWDNSDIKEFLQQMALKDIPVIPVFLPNAHEMCDLPVFLRDVIWVDFRFNQFNPVKMLVWAVTGIKP